MPTFHWTSLAFVRFVVALAAGIVAAGRVWPGFSGWGLAFGAVGAAYAGAWLAFPRRYRRTHHPAFGAAALLAIALGGAALTHAHVEAHYPGHLARLAPADTVRYYRATVVSDARTKPNTYALTAQVDAVLVGGRWRPARGKVAVSVAKEGAQVPRYGEVWVVAGSPQPVAPPLNPHAFDYRAYLAQQQVYHQHYLRPGQYQRVGYQPDWQVLAWASAARAWCNARLHRLVGSPAEAGIASALVLGVKDGLDNEIVEAYTATGTMHVLAVSGMHVGLLFLLFRWLFERFPARSRPKVLVGVVAVLSLWAYAFVTGLSASVLRAVVMFTLLLLAQAWGRRTNKYNTLAFSAFLLLIFDPFMLWDVGFQLSYLAVLGILYLYERIYRWFSVPTRVGDGLWQILAMSLAAQLATFPLSLYYFHQFPNYFLLANPPIILLGTVGLWLGIAALALGWLPLVGPWLGALLRWTIWLLNQVAGAIEALPGALWDGLHISLPELWLFYALMISLLALFHTARLGWLRAGVALALLLAASLLAEHWVQGQQRHLVVYHTSRQPNVAFRSAHTGVVAGDSSLWPNGQQLKFALEGDLLHAGLSLGRVGYWSFGASPPPGLVLAEGSGYRLLVRHGHRVLVLFRRPAFAQWPACDYLVVSQNAVRHLDQLAGASYRQLVVDASCSRYVAQQLADEARAAGVACHAVPLAGAFVADLRLGPVKLTKK
jgi:competence protein ComEC